MSNEETLQDLLNFLVEKVSNIETQMPELKSQLQLLIDKNNHVIDRNTEANHLDGTLIKCKFCGNEQTVFHFQRQTEFCKGCGIHRDMFEEWELV